MRIALLFLTLFTCHSAFAQSLDVPVSPDRRLVMELVCEHPDIVTPTAIAVDEKGRLFVAESHTHFRPDDYDGPAADRILIFEDANSDGKMDAPKVFHEGYTHLMDLAFHFDGSLYVATRMNIHRMRDTDGDDVADEITPIVLMETTGTYPHNGVAGLAFDFEGNLNFGLGENLGHNYTLIGTDGTRISGGDEGGSTYHVSHDGSNLRRVSTGWWNPFGMCVDVFGRVFGTDNDPGASPPCRLIQVIEGGDYGYEYRYGRTGLHPLITWTGDMPGVLPMVAGTGEAPCKILAYESDALPEEYLGNLLVASWADHRIEHYPIMRNDSKGLVSTERKTLFQGGNEFRPVGIALAPDGTLYVCDWVSSSYALHKKGRVWRIRPRDFQPAARPTDPKLALESLHRPLREAAARQLAETDEGQRYLVQQIENDRLDRGRVSIAAMQAVELTSMSRSAFEAKLEGRLDLVRSDGNETTIGGERSVALRRMLQSENSLPIEMLDESSPVALRAECLMATEPLEVLSRIDAVISALKSSDPLLYHSGLSALAVGIADLPADLDARIRNGDELSWLLAAKRNPRLRAAISRQGIEKFLASPNSAVRLQAIKWIADDQLTEFRPDVAAILGEADLSLPIFLAVSAALDRLDGEKPVDEPSTQRLVARLRDESTSVAIKRLALRLVDPTDQKLKLKDLTAILDDHQPGLRSEALLTMAAHPSPQRIPILLRIAQDESQPNEVRISAISGLAAVSDQHADQLVQLAMANDGQIRNTALQALVGAKLNSKQNLKLEQLKDHHNAAAESVDRILFGSPGNRPSDDDTDSWLALLDGPGDRLEGERIFHSLKVGTCSKCHRIEGRGNDVGPDLTKMRKRIADMGDGGARWLIETLLQPSRDMAPQYTTWTIVTTDGRVLTGLPRRKGGTAEAYLGIDGKEFSLKKNEIESHRESEISLMPQGLLKNLTLHELRSLFVFMIADE